MSIQDNIKTNKVTLDIELQDLLNVVSKKNAIGPINDVLSEHDLESETLKKAWYKHVLLSVEKLNDIIESVRRVDIANVRSEFKEEITRVVLLINKLESDIKSDIKDIRDKATKSEDELKSYKKDVIDPMNTKVITMVVKLGMISLIGGCVGGGIIGLIFFIMKEHIIKPAVTGGP